MGWSTSNSPVMCSVYVVVSGPVVICVGQEPDCLSDGKHDVMCIPVITYHSMLSLTDLHIHEACTVCSRVHSLQWK